MSPAKTSEIFNLMHCRDQRNFLILFGEQGYFVLGKVNEDKWNLEYFCLCGMCEETGGWPWFPDY